MKTPHHPRTALLFAAVSAWLSIAALPLAAQDSGTVRGTVVEANSRRPLGGARVSVVGTARVAVANQAGKYAITLPAGPATLRASIIGYATAEKRVNVAGGQTVQANFALTQQAVGLDEIVVTGTAGAVSKRTVGNAITKLDVEEVTAKTTVTNVVEVLQGRTPGVQVLPNSGTPGTAADIRIRGAGSFIGNQPVVYIDGIRYNTGSLGSFTPSGAGTTSYSGQETSALLNLNPNDIESIEVIKGPAAATLYGSDAAGGVIQIITKKGAAGRQGTQWNVKVERGQNELALDLPMNYTTCDAAKIAARNALREPVWPGCQGVPVGTILTDSPLRRDPNALRAGDLQRVSLSARGSGDQYSYYVSGDLNQEEGVFLNSFSNQKSIRANFSLNPSRKVDFQVSTGFIRGDLRLPLGDETAQGLLLSAFRGKPGLAPALGDSTRMGYATVSAAMANAYDNQTRIDRTTLSGTANYRPLEWFRNRLTVGMDLTSSLAQILSPPGSTDADYAGVPEGLVAQRVPRNRIFTIDYAGSVIAGLAESLESTTSFGTQITASRYEALYGAGYGLGAPDVTLIQTAQRPVSANSYSENNSVGYFVQEQLGWNNRLFVTGALRADDNSSFGENFDVIVYPKASLSWVLSEEPALSRFFDAARVNDFKFRSAWGQAGRAPAPYSATQTYSVGNVALGPTTVGSSLVTSAFGNPNLKPERGTEFEVGFDAGLLGNRVGSEFTYYHKRLTDLIIPVGIPGSAGFAGARYENLGETLNTGLELGIDGTPIQLPAFAWQTRLTLSTNRNDLVSFGDTAQKRMAISGQSYGAVQEHRPGYPLAGYWARLPLRNEDGTPVLNARGVVQLDTATYIGPSAPTREIGFSNTFTLFRNFTLYTLFDYKGGFYLFNYKEYNRCRFQANCERVNDPALQGDPEMPVYRQVPGAYIEKADFIKFRDLSLTYAVPSAWITRTGASGASVTLAVRNLGLWTDYSGIDPEVNTYGNRSFVRADIYAAPMNRRASVAVNLSF